MSHPQRLFARSSSAAGAVRGTAAHLPGGRGPLHGAAVNCQLPLRALNNAQLRLCAMAEEEVLRARQAVMPPCLSALSANGSTVHSLAAADPRERDAAANAIADHCTALFSVGSRDAVVG